DAPIIYQWIVRDHISPRVPVISVALHVLQLRLPSEASVLQPIDDVRRVPRGPRAGARVRADGGARTSEVGAARESEVVREARVHVAKPILVREGVRFREAREIRRASPAGREDVAKVLVARDEEHDVIEVLPRPDRGDGRRLTGWRGEGRWSRESGDDGEEERRERRDDCGQSKALGGGHGEVPGG